MVKYEESLRKPFTDIKKLLIGIVLSIIPIVNLVVQGFAIESSGLGKAKPSKNMPEWKDWWSLFVKGLASMIIKIIYFIPAFVVLAIAVGLAIGDVFSTLAGTVVTPDMMSQIKSGTATNEQIGMILRQNWYLILPTIIKLAPIILVGLALALIASFLAPMAVLNYVKNKRFSAAFDLGTVFKKTLNGKYIVTWLMLVILGAVLGVVLAIIPILGAAIALFLLSVIGYSLYGQVYREV
jgi:NADH:ubiquinone oxidoreductase subunit 3 (subunit A)